MCADAFCKLSACLDFIFSDKIDNGHGCVDTGINAILGEFEHCVECRLTVLASANLLIGFLCGRIEGYGHTVDIRRDKFCNVVSVVDEIAQSVGVYADFATLLFKVRCDLLNHGQIAHRLAESAKNYLFVF